MKNRRTVFNVAVLCATVIAFGSGGLVVFGSNGGGADEGAVKARAIITGPGGIEGEAIFTQHSCSGCPTPAGPPFDERDFKNFPEPEVEVNVTVSGPELTPGAHGFHIHENAICDPTAYATAGGHFDPGPFGNSTPVDQNHPFHAGDLPNVIVNDNGTGHMRHTTSRITLSPGPLSVFDANGSAVILHLNPDRGIPGPPGSGFSGGPRIACGVIELTNG